MMFPDRPVSLRPNAEPIGRSGVWKIDQFPVQPAVTASLCETTGSEL
jgi:hypothetical protein